MIQPHEVQAFLLTLPVGRIPGVGKVTESRMAQAGIKLVGDTYAMDIATLVREFGSYAQRLHELARGIDHTPVISNRVRKQISAEDTFPEDIPLTECEPHIRRLAENIWNTSRENVRGARTLVLKLKTKDFQSFTRSLTLPGPVSSCHMLLDSVVGLCNRVELSQDQLYRLVGVGLCNFQLANEPEETPLNHLLHVSEEIPYPQNDGSLIAERSSSHPQSAGSAQARYAAAEDPERPTNWTACEQVSE